MADTEKIVEFMRRDGWAYTGAIEDSGDLIFTKTKVVRLSEFPRCVYCHHLIHKSERLWVTLPGDGVTSFCEANEEGHSDV